ncbi:mycothiol transferase [Modestobacter marinus]|uniref:mycothiol transferase n=1 Tax=Modestobacter marinus TaxID=477641 RepID=UPI00201B2941|nr:DUF664 domain-containing protein [Modestobacter marinus]
MLPTSVWRPVACWAWCRFYRLPCVPARSDSHGSPIGAPWESEWAGGDWAFTSAADDSPERLYALWDDAVARSRARWDAALAAGGMDQRADLTGPDGEPAGVRRLLCDLVEEYGRHTGHADLLREAVDGLVGEDPPAGWHPRVGRRPVG